MRELAKYFVHGVAFTVLFAVLLLVWVFGLMALVMGGSLIGLGIGVGLLFLIVGFVNAVITAQLWFPVKSGFGNIMFHGILLFIVLAIVNNGIVFLPSMLFPGIATSVVSFIIASFVDGFVGKYIAGIWRDLPGRRRDEAIERQWTEKRL